MVLKARWCDTSELVHYAAAASIGFSDSEQFPILSIASRFTTDDPLHVVLRMEISRLAQLTLARLSPSTGRLALSSELRHCPAFGVLQHLDELPLEPDLIVDYGLRRIQALQLQDPNAATLPLLCEVVRALLLVWLVRPGAYLPSCLVSKHYALLRECHDIFSEASIDVFPTDIGAAVVGPLPTVFSPEDVSGFLELRLELHYTSAVAIFQQHTREWRIWHRAYRSILLLEDSSHVWITAETLAEGTWALSLDFILPNEFVRVLLPPNTESLSCFDLVEAVTIVPQVPDCPSPAISKDALTDYATVYRFFVLLSAALQSLRLIEFSGASHRVFLFRYRMFGFLQALDSFLRVQLEGVIIEGKRLWQLPPAQLADAHAEWLRGLHQRLLLSPSAARLLDAIKRLIRIAMQLKSVYRIPARVKELIGRWDEDESFIFIFLRAAVKHLYFPFTEQMLLFMEIGRHDHVD